MDREEILWVLEEPLSVERTPKDQGATYYASIYERYERIEFMIGMSNLLQVLILLSYLRGDMTL